MNIKKKKVKTNLVLVVDNTKQGEINALLKKQKTLINARLKLQKERKFIDELIKKWGDAIIKTENKITNLERDINGNAKRTINKSKHTRPNSN